MNRPYFLRNDAHVIRIRSRPRYWLALLQSVLAVALCLVAVLALFGLGQSIDDADAARAAERSAEAAQAYEDGRAQGRLEMEATVGQAYRAGAQGAQP